MTLAAPRSRRGKVTLVLGVLAALVAAAGLFLWSNQAQANMPTTTLNLSQSPLSPGPVNPGSTVIYIINIQTTGVNDNGAVVMEITFDSTNLTPVGGFPSCPLANTGGAGITWAASVVGNNARCTSSAVLTASMSTGMQFNATVNGGASQVGAPSGRVRDASNNNVAASNSASVGVLNVNGVSVDGPSTNLIGQSHTFTWTLPTGFTCFADTNGDANVQCTAADVTFNPGTTGATIGAPVVTDADMADTSFVAITISGATATGTATITLNTAVGDNSTAFPLGPDTPDATATKNFQNLAAVGGVIRHVDVECATERVAGSGGDDYGSNGLQCNGLLSNGDIFAGQDTVSGLALDDADDATGSAHTVCILSGGLTSADNANISWTILPTAGSSATVNNLTKLGMDVSGNGNLEPCVQWRSSGTGGQTITATWAPTGEVIYSNGVQDSLGTCPDNGTAAPCAPLIKQWNTIDSTKLVEALGDVGDTLSNNDGELDNWTSAPTDECVRDDNVSTTDTNCVDKANHDGETIDIMGVLNTGPVGFGHVIADGFSFIDYAIGSHTNYNGPVDGVQQTYTVTGDCGSVRLEDPVSGNVILLADDGPGGLPDSATILNSDKGVGLEFVPNDAGAITTTSANSNCDPSSHLSVTISSREDVQLRSDLDTAPDETVTIHWTVGPPTNKQPLLAWAGQRVILEHNWRNLATGECDWANRNEGPFFVRYEKQSGSGALVSDLGNGAASGPDFMVVEVQGGGDSNVDANDNCVSRVVYESQDQSEVDVVAHVVDCVGGPLSAQISFTDGQTIVDPDTCPVISQQVPFLVYYMKLEDVTLSLVPGTREGHNSGLFTADHNPILDVGNDSIPTTGDVQTLTANVSADVLARVRVRGWVLKDDCPVRVQGTDSNGSALPANRCIFPDDWRHIAGGSLAEELRPNYDIWGGDPCGENDAGPFSLLDGPLCGDSLAPHVDGGERETNFPDAVTKVNAGDASMPPSLIRLLLTGTGFIRPADKADIYDPSGSNANQYYVTHIPSDPWITPINEELSGYLWNTWGVGSKSGLYTFWTSLADKGAEVISCPGEDTDPGPGATCINGNGPAVATGGYQMIKIYSDNHGEAMAWLNGDANLDFTNCISSAAFTDPVTAGGSKIVLLNGFYCNKDVTVGTSTLTAAADYPDKRKHEPLDSNDVTVTWTWGGTKEVNTKVDPGNLQFTYVVLHITDRDGFCGSSPSLHPVLGEQVDFLIDSPDGVITPDGTGNAAYGPVVSNLTATTATAHTFDTAVTDSSLVRPTLVDGECQAWVHITSSLLHSVNVLVTAFDPEGTVTFDVTFNNATPTPVPPTPSPSPTPTPPFIWGDIDCNGDASSVDSLKTLQSVAHLPFDQVGPCFPVGSSVQVNGTARMFGDVNCDGSVNSVDSLDVLLFVASMPGLPGASGCPHVGDHVNITS